MKTTIKFFAALVVMMGFTMGAMAQTINGKAQVVAPVSVTGVNNLSFGIVSPGITKTILNDGTLGAGTAGAAALLTGDEAEKAGKFTVTKGVNTSVTLSFGTLPTFLKGDKANLPINFVDASVKKLAKLSNGITADDLEFTPSAGITTSSTNGKYFAAATFDVYIGGTVIPDAAQPAGVYSGDITLTATYN